ncbi:DUF2339 domain-containing protein [Trabulsiella odontotermitis]|uniref:DUF2339 domain-containing protein n=1 Tax=Trabulsiella odontotermitis TaxID=379893 RepID=UPI0024B654BE|nr:DUF2339 domain-containing protein [Trabulsiella odontotermitis]WHP30385.1 DUF2339 domain-containing protein [Trabulsiella odontotermitis]
MDELLFLGSVILFFALVVVPALAIIAFRRSGAMRDELAMLRRRVEQLEQQKPEPVPVPKPATVIPAVPVQKAEPAPAPVPPKVVDAKPAQPEKPTAFGGMVTSLARWFMQGNPLAKLGIILLFVGLSFLIRYSVEHQLLSLELRLALTALAAVGLLAFGWYLRHKQRVYALILQGGGTGVLYLTVFGAFRLWDMLPVSLAFGLLVLICAASVGLAILQKALSLAMLASLGGYLTPLLLSTGSGNYVALFSFYLLLSVGILAISVWQHWRELNLLGLLFTFGVGTLWGIDSWKPEYYLNSQLFLIANMLLFGVLSVVLSLRAQSRGQRVVDGILLFAPPLVGYGLQYGITQHMEYGPALSALAYGGVYMLLAWLALKRFSLGGKPLVLAALALGGAFVTLAIPLALSARWTAMAWALEGLGVLWLGVQQQQRRMSISGTVLLILALASAITAFMQPSGALTMMMISLVMSACWLAAAWLWCALRREVSWALLAGGIIFWIFTLYQATELLLDHEPYIYAVMLALLAVSAWIWRYGGIRLAWAEVGYAKWLLWPAILLLLDYQIRHGGIFTAGRESLTWLVALPSAILLLRRDEAELRRLASQGLHLSLFWMLLLALGHELFWFVRALPWGMDAWMSGLVMAAGGLAIMLVNIALRRQYWPFRVWPELYGALAMAPVAVVLLLLLIVANFQNGVVFQQRYLPLLNPLEEGAAFALLGLLVYSRFPVSRFPRQVAAFRRLMKVALLALSFWWLNGVLLRALAYFGEIPWYPESLWHSRLLQTTFALFWMLTALIVMLRATRRASRYEWLCGAVLLGVVIVKLMLVDSARGGGLARAIAFIGVAVLVLIIGYFSPLPPRAEPVKKAGEEQ